MTVKPETPEGYNLGCEHGKQWERARIIKLLEERKQEVGHSLDKIGAEAREYWQIKCRVLELENAIALIKGENK